jgi:hypothetical protein
MRLVGRVRRNVMAIRLIMSTPIGAARGDRIPVVAFLAAWALAPTADATITTLNASADSRVESAGPARNFGRETLKSAWSKSPTSVSMDATSIVAGRTGVVSVMVDAVHSGGAQLRNGELGSTGPKLDVVTTAPSGCNRVTSLAAARREIAAGRDACLANGAYSGALTLSTSARSQVRLSAAHRGQAKVSGLVTLNRHTAIDGLDLTNSSD